MAETPEPQRPMPLSTLLIPIVLIAAIGALLLTGRPPVNPMPPPGIRTPEGTPIKPSSGNAAAAPESAGSSSAHTADVPVDHGLPVYPGATVIATSPVELYRISAPFAEVRDYYLGALGDKAQYAESARDEGNWRRAVITQTGTDVTIQITDLAESDDVEVAIGPMAEVSKGAQPAPAGF